MKDKHEDKPCATCGTCPTCGNRPGARVVPYPVYPGTNPWVYPYTVTCGSGTAPTTSSTTQRLDSSQVTYTN